MSITRLEPREAIWELAKNEGDPMVMATGFVAKESSIGDPEWGMYVTPDDPQRDTPEKARRYYKNLFYLMGQQAEFASYVQAASKGSAADLDAAKRLLGA